MDKILEVSNLEKFFKVPGGILKAVNNVSFTVYKGETLGIVGESGCGKTTCGRTCIGIYKKSGGSVKYHGEEVETLKKRSKVEFTRRVQCIFQDPYSSLDPRMQVGDIIAEGIDAHQLADNRAERENMVYELMQKVGLRKEHITRYAHEFSGGQRQRIGIARALAVNPEFVFCDEPISALDVSVQAQVMNVLMDLQEEKNLTYMFVSHDISMVRHIADRIAVFYLGKIVEIGTADEVYYHPMHPYTKVLLSALPKTNFNTEKRRERIIISGEPPSPICYPQGCVFAGRCPYVTEECKRFTGELKEIAKNHMAACCQL